MWNHRRGRSSALDRATALLSGRSVYSKTGVGTRDEFQEYTDPPTKKTNSFQSPFRLLSDISSDDSEAKPRGPLTLASENRAVLEEPLGSPDGVTRSRFLKKIPPHPENSSQSPVPSWKNAQKAVSRSVSASHLRSQGAASSRPARMEDALKNRREGSGPATGTTAPEDAPVSDNDVGVRGSRFLKQKRAVVQPQNPEISMPVAYNAPKLKFVSEDVSLDSDEEDMKKLLGELSEDSLVKEGRPPSRESPGPVKKSFIKGGRKSPPFSGRKSPYRAETSSPYTSSLGQPRGSGSQVQAQEGPSYSVGLSPSPSPPNIPSPGSIASPRARFLKPSLSLGSVSSEVKSLEELFVKDLPSDDSISGNSEASDGFKMNIMTLDDLAPYTLEETGEEERSGGKIETAADTSRKTKSTTICSNVVDAKQIVSEKIQPADINVEYESDFESEIKTETPESVSDVSEFLEDREMVVSTASEVQDTVSERSTGHGYSCRSESAHGSLRTEPSSTRSESAGSDIGASRSSFLRSASRSDTVTSPRKKNIPSSGKTVRDTGVQTKMDGLSYTWSAGMSALGPSIGMSYVDPTPVASHIISAEAVEALTAYSPAVFALNDMLRQQLALTRQYVETNRYLHTSFLESLGSADYCYTTLEETKEFIRSHKSPRLTVDEALEEVLQDMRDYHYI